MGQKGWLGMVRSGEGLQVEFKRQLPKTTRLSKSLSAFSNSSGGTMFFGVDDDGHLVGLEHVAGTQAVIEQVAEFNCEPPAQISFQVWEPVRGTVILVCEIAEGEDKPVYAVSSQDKKDAWPFFRSDKENLPMDKQSIKTMRRLPALAVDDELKHLDKHALRIINKLAESPRQTLPALARSINISSNRAKKIVVDLEQNGWIYSFFNEKRREYSLAIPWKKR
jgi:predicted HTH transcriptional regulator